MRFGLLSQLWLHEPDPGTAVRAFDLLGLPQSDPAELAQAYADLFLLSVQPYGTVFTDPSGEMNGPAAQRLSWRYAQVGYRPAELQSTGAPDHVGLVLGLLDHAATRGLETVYGETCAELLAWAPLVCLAVERAPAAQAFYRALAATTAEALLLNAGHLAHWPPMWPTLDRPELAWVLDTAVAAEDEVRLRDLVSFFLTPARSGMFLSRTRLGWLARGLGLALPFSSRFQLAETLFASAGQAGQFDALLDGLAAEAEAWAATYRQWETNFPAWGPAADHWLGCAAGTLRLISAMRRQARAGVESVAADPG